MMHFSATLDEIDTKCRIDNSGTLHCYKLYTETRQFGRAKAHCASRNEHLITISSKEEMDFVIRYLVERKLLIYYALF